MGAYALHLDLFGRTRVDRICGDKFFLWGFPFSTKRCEKGNMRYISELTFQE